MSKALPISLDRLRELGWSLWDPIGLEDSGCPRDEYDTYLWGLVSRLLHGASEDEAADYLVAMEARTIGLTPRADTQGRAEALVAAVGAYLRSFSGGRAGVH